MYLLSIANQAWVDMSKTQEIDRNGWRPIVCLVVRAVNDPLNLARKLRSTLKNLQTQKISSDYPCLTPRPEIVLTSRAQHLTHNVQLLPGS